MKRGKIWLFVGAVLLVCGLAGSWLLQTSPARPLPFRALSQASLVQEEFIRPEGCLAVTILDAEERRYYDETCFLDKTERTYTLVSSSDVIAQMRAECSGDLKEVSLVYGSPSSATFKAERGTSRIGVRKTSRDRWEVVLVSLTPEAKMQVFRDRLLARRGGILSLFVP